MRNGCLSCAFFQRGERVIFSSTAALFCFGSRSRGSFVASFGSEWYGGRRRKEKTAGTRERPHSVAPGAPAIRCPFFNSKNVSVLLFSQPIFAEFFWREEPQKTVVEESLSRSDAGRRFLIFVSIRTIVTARTRREKSVPEFLLSRSTFFE